MYRIRTILICTLTLIGVVLPSVTQPLQAANEVYLPSISSTQTATTNQSPGAQRVSRAGRLNVMPEYDQGLVGNVKVESGLTYDQVMANTRANYSVRGGAADSALQPIGSDSSAEMYQKIKEFLADKESANYSTQNPGVPIAYTLRCPDDRNLARWRCRCL